MELNAVELEQQNAPLVTMSSAPLLCSYCHQPLLPQYYFCPNCGTKVKAPPLSTTPLAQAWLYGFSIILPVICYLAVSKWQGQKYFRSADPQAKQIGAIAWTLLILSTIVTFWYYNGLLEGFLQSAQSTASSQSTGL
jgi:hypothetical protein